MNFRQSLHDETGGGMRADDSPLHLNNSSAATSEFNGTLKSHRSAKRSQAQGRRIETESGKDMTEGDGSRAFRGEQVQAKVIKRSSDANFEMVSHSH